AVHGCRSASAPGRSGSSSGTTRVHGAALRAPVPTRSRADGEWRAIPDRRPRHRAGRSMIVVGLNAYHGDVSAVLVRDGQLVAAIEEERFRRIKHCAGFPHRALAECLRMAGAEPSEVDLFAVSRNPRAHLWRKALFLLRHRPKRTVGDRTRNMARIAAIPSVLAETLGLDAAHVRRRTRYIEHHPSHPASAAFVSPFDQA